MSTHASTFSPDHLAYLVVMVLDRLEESERRADQYEVQWQEVCRQHAEVSERAQRLEQELTRAHYDLKWAREDFAALVKHAHNALGDDDIDPNEGVAAVKRALTEIADALGEALADHTELIGRDSSAAIIRKLSEKAKASTDRVPQIAEARLKVHELSAECYVLCQRVEDAEHKTAEMASAMETIAFEVQRAFGRAGVTCSPAETVAWVRELIGAVERLSCVDQERHEDVRALIKSELRGYHRPDIDKVVTFHGLIGHLREALARVVAERAEAVRKAISLRPIKVESHNADQNLVSLDALSSVFAQDFTAMRSVLDDLVEDTEEPVTEDHRDDLAKAFIKAGCTPDQVLQPVATELSRSPRVVRAVGCEFCGKRPHACTQCKGQLCQGCCDAGVVPEPDREDAPAE